MSTFRENYAKVGNKNFICRKKVKENGGMETFFFFFFVMCGENTNFAPNFENELNRNK